ncbi:hypothetical protein ACHAXT_006840 [Thalassiosira profunda]
MAQPERLAAPVCPGSPGGSAQHSDHHSDLTGSTTEDDENFIALLQYKDAYHILTLDPRTSQISPKIIQEAYDVAKQQTLVALEQFEATEKQSGGGRNTFFLSQQNYLELKLQALDQAYEELMHDRIVTEDESDSHIANIVDSQNEGSPEAPPEAEAPPSPSVGLNGIDDKARGRIVSPESDQPNAFVPIAGDARPNEFVSIDGGSNESAAARIESEDPGQNNSQPSEDELDTIDVYFRPSSPTRSQSRAKSPEHPSDASHCTWDGSSIFSMVSKAQQSLEEASGGGLSDVLGLLPAASATTNEDEETPDAPSNHRPPSGINVKQRSRRPSPKAQISPTSVSGFHAASIHDHQHYDSSSMNKGKKVVGRGGMMKTRRAASASQNPPDATEAARMGILRALSEDNSVCLPLDDDDDHAHLNVSNDTTGLSEHAKFMARHPAKERIGNTRRGQQSKSRIFEGKSDAMPKDGNSLMASVRNEKQSQAASVDPSTLVDNEQASEERDESERAATTRSEPSADTPRSRQRRKAKPSAKRNTYGGSVRSEDYSYDGILDLADELCTTLNNCWKGDLEVTKTLARAGSAAFDAAASEFDRSNKDDESTLQDDSTYQNRSVYTDGESTAFDTQSSFRRRDDAPDMKKKKKVPRSFTSSPATTSSSDPPPRMLV